MTYMTRKNFILLLALATAFMTPPAHALEKAPSDGQLQQPGLQQGSAQQPGTMPPMPAPQGTNAAQQTVPSAAPAMPKTAGSAMPARTNNADPCPMADDAAKATPDDLAKVQEEIDRFTLCVQRAQLIERLNESAMKNQMADDAALGYKNVMPAPPGGAMPGMMPGVAGMQANSASMTALPANALGGADVSPLPASKSSKDAEKAVSDALTGQNKDKGSSDAEAAKETVKEWTIREIYGSGDSMQAKLVSPDGSEVKTRNGMKLPDGKTTVVRITPAGVTVRGQSGAKSLEWAKT